MPEKPLTIKDLNFSAPERLKIALGRISAFEDPASDRMDTEESVSAGELQELIDELIGFGMHRAAVMVCKVGNSYLDRVSAPQEEPTELTDVQES